LGDTEVGTAEPVANDCLGVAGKGDTGFRTFSSDSEWDNTDNMLFDLRTIFGRGPTLELVRDELLDSTDILDDDMLLVVRWTRPDVVSLL